MKKFYLKNNDLFRLSSLVLSSIIFIAGLVFCLTTKDLVLNYSLYILTAIYFLFNVLGEKSLAEKLQKPIKFACVLKIIYSLTVLVDEFTPVIKYHNKMHYDIIIANIILMICFYIIIQFMNKRFYGLTGPQDLFITACITISVIYLSPLKFIGLLSIYEALFYILFGLYFYSFNRVRQMNKVHFKYLDTDRFYIVEFIKNYKKYFSKVF